MFGKIVKKFKRKLSGDPNTPEAVKNSQSQTNQGISRKPMSSFAPKGDSRRPDTRRHGDRRRPGIKRESSTEPGQAKVHKPPQPIWSPSDVLVEPMEGKTRFGDLNLPVEIMHGISDIGFKYCTPIQAATLPNALVGKDISGRAQTGTGKTAAFLITILNYMYRNPVTQKRRPGTPRALIMTPTRELALQIKKDADMLGKYVRCRVDAIFGGMDYQKQKLMLVNKQMDIIVATPGRLLDYKRQGDLHLGQVEIMVIDEADRMLDMGFIPDMRQIIQSMPPRSKRQTMFFGATLTASVARLATQWTLDPVTVEINPEQVAVDTIKQIVYLVRTRERFTILCNLITQQNLQRVIVFCNRRDQTNRLADRLRAQGISCAILSGEVAQKKRISTLEDFRSGRIRIMVATDVAGRGIHIDGISHVVNYNLPQDPEDYVHRIGRTGRAGAVGTSLSFATEDDAFLLPPIEEYLKCRLNCVYPEDGLLTPLPAPLRIEPEQRRPVSRPRQNRNKR